MDEVVYYPSTVQHPLPLPLPLLQENVSAAQELQLQPPVPLPQSLPVIAPVSLDDDPIYQHLKRLLFVQRKNVLLMGFGGSGKSYIIRALASYAKDYCRAAGVPNALHVTATTGVAAINVKGQTMHRFFGVGLAQGPADKLVEMIRYRRHDAVKRICEATILIGDEVSMLSEEFFSKLDYICKSIRRCREPFGGLQVMLSGDFLQLPPVNGEWVFKSAAWAPMAFTPVFLTVPKRFTDKSYSDMLMRIREGVLLPSDAAKLRERTVAYRAYTERLKTLTPQELLTVVQPTKIYPHRAKVEEQNIIELDKLQGVGMVYLARDALKTSAGVAIPKAKADNYSETLDTMAPKLTTLKIGAQVMLTYNLDLDAGLCNGSRGVITALHATSATVNFINDPGVPVDIQYQEFTYEDSNVKLIRMQLPLVLAWAQTVHKGQGATLDFCAADVGVNTFAPGQAYVALSRVRGWDSLLLVSFDPRAIKADPEALAYVRQLEELAG